MGSGMVLYSQSALFLVSRYYLVLRYVLYVYVSVQGSIRFLAGSVVVESTILASVALLNCNCRYSGLQ